MGLKNNYKMLIQYDGTNYAGWQHQENAVTIQQKIVEAIKTFINENFNLIGSGRTDSGVHALGQVANFQTHQEIDLYKFKYSLNSVLPKDISILNIQKTYPEFHSRYDAKRRSYYYLISKNKSPFYDRYSFYYGGELSCEQLNLVSMNLLGEHDFTSFCKRNTETKNKICNVYNANWKETRGLIFFLIEADRFLHGMVRTIVGTVLHSVKNDFDNSFIRDVLKSKDREAAGESVPAKGLFLYKVKYDGL
jgi:tRNA pseudouridine38-40 synthase